MWLGIGGNKLHKWEVDLSDKSWINREGGKIIDIFWTEFFLDYFGRKISMSM